MARVSAVTERHPVMIFHASTIDLINIIFLAVGIGVCGMIFLQISRALYLDRKLKRILQTFFAVLAVNLAAQITVQTVLGHPGEGIRSLLAAALFIDFAVGGFVSFFISFVVLAASQPVARPRLCKAASRSACLIRSFWKATIPSRITRSC